MPRNCIAFDLEGPLSPNDHAYELMSLYPGGEHTFEVLSRYDDLLALAGKEGYEPGDTLSLIVPFLLLHRIGAKEMASLAAKAGLVAGAQELVSHLAASAWQVTIITTTYQPYAFAVAARLGVPSERVAATPYPAAELTPETPPSLRQAVPRLEAEIARLQPERDDQPIQEILDRFFWGGLANSTLAPLMAAIKPVGGSRKVTALKRLFPQPLDRVAAVGDSITDFPMLREVDRAGGLAIAFNANQYALPYASAGLASTHISDLLPLLEVWRREGREGTEAWVREREREGGEGERGHFHWLHGEDWKKAMSVHSRLRRLVRSRAAALG